MSRIIKEHILSDIDNILLLVEVIDCGLFVVLYSHTWTNARCVMNKGKDDV